MKPLIVQNQTTIGVMRCLALSLQGMSYRMFRSLITVSILGLAVTFLIHMVAYGLIAHDTKLLAYHQLKDSRLLEEWTARLTLPDTETTVVDALKSPLAGTNERLEEYRQWSGASPAVFEETRKIARRTEEAWSYFEGLPVAMRAALTVGSDATNALSLISELGDSHQYELFREHLKQLSLRPPLRDIGAFETLVRVDAPKLAAMVRSIRAGQAQAIGGIRSHFDNRDPNSLFADPPPDFGAMLASEGFRISQATIDRVSAQAKSAMDIARLGRALYDGKLKNAVARHLSLSEEKVDLPALMKWLDSQDKVAWLSSELSKIANADVPPAARILQLAESVRSQTAMQKVAGDEIPTERTSLLALPSQTLWLITVSFLVCVVGVANAMLMSVTERFTEIATMKCLGALDGFVTQVFFFEALLQGFFGGLAGIFLGVLLAVLRCLWEFGTLSMHAAPVGGIVMCSLLAWGVGITLAGAAAIGPVVVAARLAPMEAMRVE